MLTKKTTGVMVGILIIIEIVYLTYYYFEKEKADDFTCAANLVQHYNGEAYYIAINYIVRKHFGLVHITGVSEKNPVKMFNRKISFKLQRKGDIFYMTSDKNIRLPDDNMDDEELRRYEPGFFVAAGKDIYMRVLKQKNNSFVFMVDAIPTYVCNAMAVEA